MINKYQPIKQCSCRMCRIQSRGWKGKRWILRVANRQFRQQSRLQLNNFLLSPEMDVERIIVSADLFS